MNEEQKARIYKDISSAAQILEDARTRLVDELGEDADDITNSLYYTIKRIHEDMEAIANLPMAAIEE